MDTKGKMTLQKAIEMGEYTPSYLEGFSEWKDYTTYQKLQFIKEGMDNRRRKLTEQLAELYNVLDLRLKPELQTAIDNLHKHLSKIEEDREKYYLEYSGKLD